MKTKGSKKGHPNRKRLPSGEILKSHHYPAAVKVQGGESNGKTYSI
jgi:hypothetical protein